MNYKWSSETFRKTEIQSTGESHEYSGERYWIDISDTEGLKLDIVLKKVTRDSEAPIVTGRFRVNGLVVKRWEASSIQEAAAIGEKLIDSLKKGMSDALQEIVC